MRPKKNICLTALLSVALSSALAAPVIAPAQAADDSSFTIIDVPDTQQEVMAPDAPLLTDRYNWIVQNAKTMNTKFIVQTGDLVNWGVADPVQFTRADQAVKILDNSGIPYAQAIGNHDGAAVDVGGSAAPGNVHDNLRNTTLFNKTFPLARFKNVGGTFENNKVDNMYQTFSAGGKDWLVLTLEMWPRQAAIDWAKTVVAAHPKYNVIINTHANVDSTGARQISGVYGDENAQVVWDKLGSQYANIRMILSGHYEPKNGSLGAYHNEVRGVHGNKVLQVMTAYTSLYQNHTRILTVDPKAMTVSSRVYINKSTNKNYPTGYIKDAHSDFTASAMDWLSPTQATIPGKPTAVTATGGDGSATVSFVPAANSSSDTKYTVTSQPGGITASGTASPIVVKGLTNGVKYTFTVRASNAAGTGPASDPSAAVTPSGGVQLLPDPGFEQGNGGWIPFNVGTFTRVNSPVHSGSYAMKVVSPLTDRYDLVGMTQNTVVTSSVAGRRYTATCYVRPSTAGLEVRIGLLEYAQDFSSNIKMGTNIVNSLPADAWTPVTISGTATASGKRIIPQIYASFQTKNTGYLVYDDCTLTYDPAP